MSDKNRRLGDLVLGKTFSEKQGVTYIFYSGHGEIATKHWEVYLVGFFSLPDLEQKKVLASTWPDHRCPLIFLNSCLTGLHDAVALTSNYDDVWRQYEDSIQNLSSTFSQQAKGIWSSLPEIQAVTTRLTSKLQSTRFLHPPTTSPEIVSPVVRVSAVEAPTIQLPEGDDDEGEMVIAPILGVAFKK